MRLISIGDLFTEKEIKDALKIWRTDREQFHHRVMAEIVRPAMPRINQTTRQENLEAYIAYVLEYTIMIMVGKP